VAGTLCIVVGTMFLRSTAWTYMLSLSETMDLPNWARALGHIELPIGFFGIPLASTVARRGPGRFRGRIGLGLATVALVAFVAIRPGTPPRHTEEKCQNTDRTMS
jgi:hypothetical protein